MIRPWRVGLIFGVCLAVVFVALGWITATVVDLQQRQDAAARQAALEESVRLTLWRMDSALAPLVAQENSRPYFSYSAFYPAQRAYTAMFAAIQPGEVLIPSRLLTNDSPDVLLHFQFGPDGVMTSPQVPTGNMRDLAEASYATTERINDSADRLRQLARSFDGRAITERLPDFSVFVCSTGTANETPANADPTKQRTQSFRNSMEFQKRSINYAQATTQAQLDSQGAVFSGAVQEGVLMPAWNGERMLLARRVSVHGTNYVQGCWLDWPSIKSRLLTDVRDLLPNAELHPVQDEAEPASDESGFRRLATLPVRLEPGPLPDTVVVPTAPLRLSLVLAWSCVIVAAAAVAVLMVGAMTLSERRGAFVSAVTHELRSPLTTFRMYTEMLAKNMVPEPERRQSYLTTLHAEADRLGHLVENVLAYARLERGRIGKRAEPVSIGELIDAVSDRLWQRCERSSIQFVFECGKADLPTLLAVDRMSLEQILFNLVDNACKYGTGSADRRVHLRVQRCGKQALLSVRDHGDGVAPADSRRLFRLFSKSAAAAANSGPGVGLGLALSRRLARHMGGALYLDRSVTDGACFVVVLPVAE